MANLKKLRLVLAVTAVALLLPPIAVRAFDLIELIIKVTISLPPGQEYTEVFYPDELPYTGFSIANPEQDDIFVDGLAALSPAGRQEGEKIQDGFALVDNTLLIDVTATDTQNLRAGIRMGTRMDVAGERLGREYLRALLLDQGVVTGELREQRALRRARAMDLADARMMRFDESGGRWIRAVRAIRAGRALDTTRSIQANVAGAVDFRFKPQTEPDGVLGHYGNFKDASGNAYVWAVTDVDQRYAVGFTIDRDDDGVPNSNDNCVNVTNADQANHDTDTLGDACDSDDDGDGISDSNDNCPLVANADQADIDLDGIGDICDADNDNDGLNDGIDQCLDTPAGSVVNADGCAIADLCPCDSEWKNHGAYVRCNTRASNAFLDAGLITDGEKDDIMSMAGQSNCGSRQ